MLPDGRNGLVRSPSVSSLITQERFVTGETSLLLLVKLLWGCY